MVPLERGTTRIALEALFKLQLAYRPVTSWWPEGKTREATSVLQTTEYSVHIENRNSYKARSWDAASNHQTHVKNA